MTQLTEHAKDILRAIADGKVIEKCVKGVWTTEGMDLAHVASYLSNYELMIRIKPETRSINGKEFAAPVPPEPGRYQYLLDVGDHNYWFDKEEDRDTAYQAIVDALEGKTK